MRQSGSADLPLHNGHVPPWLAQRMASLGGAILESIILEYGRQEVIKRLSDPFWFQALGCVLGMDWHSSGITTSVMGALKKSMNPKARELGIFFCGGKGKHSRQTPQELLRIADQTGLDGNGLVYSSKLAAKIDNTAIQDGFQLYLHCFIVTADGEWAIVQQGMNGASGMARRYHWHSKKVESFVNEPHAFIYGKNQGTILNLVDKQASTTRSGILSIAQESPVKIMQDVKKLVMPRHHDVKAENVDLKRLGSVLALAHERGVRDFEDLLLTEGLGPRTLQSLTLVSEVIHGTSTRFSDPARFSFAHGGKDGHPFPVPLKVYDKVIETLETGITKAKTGEKEKHLALKNLSKAAVFIEKSFVPNDRFEDLIRNERENSYKYNGRTVFGKAKQQGQLDLFQ